MKDLSAARWIACAALVSALLPALAIGCGDDSTTSTAGDGSTGAGGAGTGGAAPEGWIAGRCGVCFAGQCAAEVAACDADPGCAATYGCLVACAAEPVDGPAAVACSQACTVPDSSTAQQAYASVEACRLTGEGALACPDCSDEVEPTCTPLEPPTNCSLCLERECCDVVGPYRENPEGQAFGDCVNSCLDGGGSLPQCTLECNDVHPDGLIDWSSTVACAFTLCLGADNCEDPGGSTDPCLKCTADHCVDSYRACYADAQCIFLDGCRTQCVLDQEDDPDLDLPDCFAGCDEQYPGGVALDDTFLTCTVASCEQECF